MAVVVEAATDMVWDSRYRPLEMGEIILDSDEVQREDGSWDRTRVAGTQAPDPAYTSHRTYRRRLDR